MLRLSIHIQHTTALHLSSGSFYITINSFKPKIKHQYIVAFQEILMNILSLYIYNNSVSNKTKRQFYTLLSDRTHTLLS